MTLGLTCRGVTPADSCLALLAFSRNIVVFGEKVDTLFQPGDQPWLENIIFCSTEKEEEERKLLHVSQESLLKQMSAQKGEC